MKLKEIENKAIKQLLLWYKSKNEKQKRVIKLIPYIIIYMSILTYFSGFIKTLEDVLVFIIGAVILGLFSFFIPISKLLNQE